MPPDNPSMQQLSASTRTGASQNSSAVTDLEAAIATFKDTLTDDDRKKLETLKTASHDSQSIIQFTTQLDRVDANRRGRSIASRLASFLQTVEQFTPIIDTYIQSNPEITALIWGSIKLTFLFLANFTSYFQSFVELLDGFGSLCKRFAEYQSIFNDPVRLKDPICRFHIAVVTCCEKILQVIRRPALSRIASALTKSFQSEIQSYVADIRTKAEIVQHDIEFVKAGLDRNEQQLQAMERKAASDHRKGWLGWTSRNTAAMKVIQAQNEKASAESTRHRLLRELSSFNSTSTFNSQRRRRHLGTAEWIFETDEFKEWSTGKGNPVLHITGKIGSGKTVLAASAIERLCLVSYPRRFTSFGFVRFNDAQSLKAETIIRSCLQQLLSALSPHQISLELNTNINLMLEEAKREMYSDQSLVDLYSMASKLVTNWYIVLDGLDECEPDHQRDILKFFKKILSSSQKTTYLMLCSRETSSSAIDQAFPKRLRLITGLKQTSEDVCKYVEDIIASKVEENELVVQSQDLVKESLTTIVSKEKGMFLWAFLTIEDICSRKSDREIKKALREIPRNLPTTFDRALGRIMKKGDQEIAKKAFAWIEAAFQPLTISQLQEALSIEIGQKSIHQDDLINDISRLTGWCENLVEVEETDGTVHFSHHSIREFLLMPGIGKHKDLHIVKNGCHQLVGETCITYIALDNFQRAVINTIQNPESAFPSLDMREITAQTVQNAVKGDMGSRLSRLVRRRAKSEQSTKVSATTSLAPYMAGPQLVITPEVKGYPFFTYAKDNWFKHTVYLNSLVNEATWEILGTILNGNISYPGSVPWDDEALQHEFMKKEQYGVYSKFVRAYTYAHRHSNWGFCCRAFMLLAEEAKKLKESPVVLNALAAEKDHRACRNGCIFLIKNQLNHPIFVAKVTQAIGKGISYFPALGNPRLRCNCNIGSLSEHLSTGLDEDICNIIRNGYYQEEHPYLQILANLAEELRCGKFEAEDLCKEHGIDIDDLAEAKTISSRSVFDILAHAVLRKQINPSVLVPERFRSTFHRKSRLVIGILSQLLLDRHECVENLPVLSTGIAEEVSNFVFDGGMIYFHPTTVERIFELLIVPVLRGWKDLDLLVQFFFTGSITLDFGTSMNLNFGYTYERVLRNSVWNNNWDLARCMAGFQPCWMDKLHTSSKSTWIREALRCSACYTDHSKGEAIANRKGAHQNSLRLCDEHWSIYENMADQEIFNKETRSIICSGYPITSLPSLEDKGLLR